MSPASRRLLLVAKVVISVLLIVYLLRRIGIDETAARASTLPFSAAAIAIALLLLYVAAAAGRWAIVLHALAVQVRFAAVVRITFIATFFNQFLPTSIGADAVRVWESFQGGLDLASTIHSVILERAAYLAAVSLLAALGASLWSDGRIPFAGLAGLWAVAGAVLLGLLVLVASDRIKRLVPGTLREQVLRLAQSARSVFSRPTYLASSFLAALIGQLLLCLALLAVARGLGVELGFAACAALLPAVVLFSSLPISVAGWGVREYSMVVALGYAGVSAADALAMSIVLAVLSALASLPGALLWLTRRRVLPAGKDARR